MNAVFGFIPNGRLRAVDHAIGHFLTAMRRQAKQEHGVRPGLRHQRLVDLIGRHCRKLFLGVGLARRRLAGLG